MKATKKRVTGNEYILISLCFIVWGLSMTTAQEVGGLPLDSSVVHGTLANGFTYYIKETPEPTPTINIRLYVKTGYRMEGKSQLSMAHFIEHQPPKWLKAQLREKDSQLYMEVLNDINAGQASTHLDYTDYNFRFSAEHTQGWELGLDYFSHIVSGAFRASPKVVEAEQGAFYQEYLYRNGKDFYPHDRMVEIFSDYTAEAVSPENYYEHVKQFNVPELDAFFKQWYTVDRSALVVTGTIDDVNAVVARLAHAFGSIPPSQTYVEASSCAKDYQERQSQFLILPQKDTGVLGGGAEIYLFIRKPNIAKQGIAQLHTRWTHALLDLGMQNRIHNRFATLSSPYEIVLAQDKTLPALQLKVSGIHGKGQEAAGVAWRMVKGIREHGFTIDEFNTLKQQLVTAHTAVEPTSQGYWLTQLKDTFVHDIPLPTGQYTAYANWLEHVSLGQINRALKAYIPSLPQDIAIICDGEDPLGTITDEEFRKGLDTAKATVPTMMDIDTSLPLITESRKEALHPIPYIEKGKDTLGAEVINLANGIRVILNDTKTSRIRIHGFRPYGVKTLESNAYTHAQLLPSLIKHLGLGELDGQFLAQKLAGLNIPYGTSAYVDDLESGIKLSGSADQLEILLQMVYLHFQPLSITADAFTLWKQEARKDILNPGIQESSHNLQVQMNRYLGALDAGITFKERFNALEAVTSESMEEVHRSLYGAGQGYTFIISGDLAGKDVKGIIAQYLGHIPVKQDFRKANSEPLKTLPKGPKYTEFENPYMVEQEAQLKVSYIFPLERGNWKGMLDTKILALLLKQPLSKLRNEKMRGIYLSAVRGNYKPNSMQGEIGFYIPTLPDMTPTLIHDIQEMVTELQTQPIAPNRLDRLLNVHLKPYIRPQRGDKALYIYYQYGMIYPEPEEVKRYIAALTPERIMELANNYLIPMHRYTFVSRGKNNLN